MTLNLLRHHQPQIETKVEWDELKKIITKFVHFESSQSQLFSDQFLENPSDLNDEFEKIKRYIDSLTEEHKQFILSLIVKLPPGPDFEKSMIYLAKGGVLTFTELNHMALLIEGCQSLSSTLKFNFDEFKQLKDIDFSPIQRSFLKEFRGMVEENGEVRLEKHPQLKELFNLISDLEDRLRKSLHEWITRPENSRLLQFMGHDLQLDHFVVPIRSDSFKAEIGSIISRSESGSTLFVEPYFIRDISQKRLMAKAKVQEIINQLCHQFSRKAEAHSQDLSKLLKLIIGIDFYLGKSRFIEAYHLNQPSISTKPGFYFSQIFHPLLKNPVKNQVHCREMQKGIVISGPNTGGKTVFLKSIAISYLLFSHGFYVPALEAELYPYKGLFYFGNDLQDLKSGLSSFSGEVKSYISLMENLDQSNLILIDEIFNSTSSDEASALTLSYFEELHKMATCHIVVSTHHQMFKTLVHQDEEYLSCHVGFDPIDMKPTYQIIWGTPGASMAIDIFKLLNKHNNFGETIAKNAGKYLNDKNISYESLLQKVTLKQIELDRLMSSTLKQEKDLINQKSSLEGILNLRLNETLSKAKNDIEKIFLEARFLLEEVKSGSILKSKTLENKVFEISQEFKKISQEQQNSPRDLSQGDIDLLHLKKGDRVMSHVLKKEFNVEAIDMKKKLVTLIKGSVKLTVPAETLSKLNGPTPKHKVHVQIHKNSNAKLEYDVRGMRLSEFESLIDTAIGDLLCGDVPYLSIIHGHGDGVLKNWLRSFLKRSPELKTELSESGNDGETKILLK
jgi:DNA mismatch repair protein MutS2